MFRLANEYKVIVVKAKTPPVDTAELMELGVYMKIVEEETLAELEKKFVQVKERTSFLVDYGALSSEDLKLTVDTFSYSGQMQAVLEENKDMMVKKRLEFEEALKVIFF